MDPFSAAPGRRTGLVVLVPAAEPVVGGWRVELDPSARYGMPAHVIVLFPWFRLRDLGAQVLSELASVATDLPAFDVTFDRVAHFPETLWLAPTPVEPFVELTEAVRRNWPTRGSAAGSTSSSRTSPSGTASTQLPHRHVVTDIEQSLPVRARVAELTLMAQDAGAVGRCTRRTRFSADSRRPYQAAPRGREQTGPPAEKLAPGRASSRDARRIAPLRRED